jgi:LuxR family maltose regulon positive regulatory protein
MSKNSSKQRVSTTSAAPLVAHSKISIPKVSPRTLYRQRLAKVLSHAMSDKRVTLLLAPAGYGKTTLVASWLAQKSTSLPVAWLSMDAHDTDLTRFCTYLHASLLASGILEEPLELEIPSEINSAADFARVVTWLDALIAALGQKTTPPCS